MKIDNRSLNIIAGVLVLSLFIFSSCLKEEKPVLPPQPGDVETVQIEIGFPYVNQVYYDCVNNKIVKDNSKYEWDISFECSPKGYHVLLNTAKGVFVSNYGEKPFESIPKIQDIKWTWDKPNGDLASTGIGEWRNKNELFIIDRQFGQSGKHLGYKKIVFQTVNNNSYTCRYANLDGSNEQFFNIQKDTSLNFIHFTLEGEGKLIKLEPNKNDWDLLFTNHYHKFSNLPLPFVLTQTLSNKHNGVRIAQDNGNNFINISLKDTSNYTFTDTWDEIGYDWKIRNSQDNSFSIDINKSYIVRTTTGLYYKLRFINFYTDQGVKGYPKFEVQRL